LYNLKPYHVDLYSIANFGIRCQDKFNQVYIDDESNMSFLYQIMYASLLTFSDDCLFNYIFNAESNVNLLNNFTFNVLTSLPDEDDESTDLYDEATMDYKTTIASILQTATDYLMELNKDLVSDVICVESYTVTKVL